VESQGAIALIIGLNEKARSHLIIGLNEKARSHLIIGWNEKARSHIEQRVHVIKQRAGFVVQLSLSHLIEFLNPPLRMDIGGIWDN